MVVQRVKKETIQFFMSRPEVVEHLPAESLAANPMIPAMVARKKM